MASPDRTDRERAISPESVGSISAALDRFCGTTMVTRTQLACGLGFHRSDLSPSHLSDRALLLSWCLRRDALPGLAAQFALDLNGFRELERLSSTVTEVISGFSIPTESWLGSRREAVDASVVGTALYDQSRWREATTYLTHAWDYFVRNPPTPEGVELVAALRSGTHLVHWLCFQAQPRQAVTTLQTVLKFCRAYSGNDPQVLRAVAEAQLAAGVASRHHALTSSLSAIGYSHTGFQILEALGSDRNLMVAALRDQAKPFLQAAQDAGDGGTDHPRARASIRKLETASSLIGGTDVEPPAWDEWLYTRLTQVECHIVLGQDDEARACWEETMEQPWVGQHVASDDKRSLQSKVRFVEIAVTIAEGDADRVVEACRTYRSDKRHKAYSDRLACAADIQAAAEAHDLNEARRKFLE